MKRELKSVKEAQVASGDGRDRGDLSDGGEAFDCWWVERGTQNGRNRRRVREHVVWLVPDARRIGRTVVPQPPAPCSVSSYAPMHGHSLLH